MGFALMMAPCILCGRVFGFNPVRVPSVMVRGRREPVCETCHKAAQEKQRAAGVEVWPDPLPGAYEGAPEEEVF